MCGCTRLVINKWTKAKRLLVGICLKINNPTLASNINKSIPTLSVTVWRQCSDVTVWRQCSDVSVGASTKDICVSKADYVKKHTKGEDTFKYETVACLEIIKRL